MKLRLGVMIEETWSFFHEIYADFQQHYETTLFRRRHFQQHYVFRRALPVFRTRVNDHLFRRDVGAFLRRNDVVFCEWASELLAAASRQPTTCPLVARLHRYELYQWADRINWDAVARVIVVSQAKRREFVARFPAHAAKAIVIPEAVSLSRFRSQIKPFAGNIGILCHLTPRKRVYELILAFADLIRLDDRFHLHIGGGRHERFGDYYVALHDLVRELGLEERVTFYGHVAQPEEWYRRIDIFVSNSYSEGLQVSPLEAIASGCYCLSHRWAGAEEMLPAENLFYTNQELIERILAYAHRPQPQREEAIAALQAIIRERFDIARTTAQIRQVIDEVAAQA
jgi:glycosyltransferase involved in cell wall biosynthesis